MSTVHSVTCTKQLVLRGGDKNKMFKSEFWNNANIKIVTLLRTVNMRSSGGGRRCMKTKQKNAVANIVVV